VGRTALGGRIRIAAEACVVWKNIFNITILIWKMKENQASSLNAHFNNNLSK
jgi:hypothetical protein